MAPTLELPGRALVVLVGPAGAGKSTLAERHFAPSEVLSSDAIRAELTGDPGDQRVTRRAFELLDRRLEARLAAGRTCVVDATNVTAAARHSLLRIARVHRTPAVAIVLALDPAIVRARNAGRDRVVPAEAVARHHAALDGALRADAFRREGFAAVVVLETPEAVEALVISRRAARPD